MKAKALLYPVLLALVLALVGTACKSASGSRGDAQVASDVQSKIFSDPNVQSRQISVQSSNGVVTLSGFVNSDAERNAAAADAAGIEGVKTVVNNLQTQQAQATPPPAQAEPTPEPVTQPATESRGPARMREHRPSPARSAAVSSGAGAAAPAMSSSSQPQMQAAAPPPPPPPPQPKKVTVPAGTNLSVRLIDNLDSEKNQIGDQFRGTLNAPIVIDDEVVIPQDADVQGRVVSVKSAGRYAGGSELAIELTTIGFNGKTYNLSTNQWSRQGTGRGKSTAAKIGGGSALGAIIGGIAGGGKGAAIGATVGAGAGTGVASVGKGEQIKLGSEALLSFSLQAPLTITVPPGGAHTNRQPMNQ